MIRAASINTLSSKSLSPGHSNLAIANSLVRAIDRNPHAGFLGLIWLALALSVVTVIEPSPGDVGVALLLAGGFVFDRLKWQHLPVLPLALLALFVLSNGVSLCFAVDLRIGASHGLITVFMLSLWFFIVGVVSQFKERGLRVLMSGYSVGGVISAALALLAYVGFISKMTPFVAYLNVLRLDDTLLFLGERLKGFFKDPNVFGPYLVVVACYALFRLQAPASSYLKKSFWAASSLLCALGVLLCFSRAAWANYVVTLAMFLLLNSLSGRARGGIRRNLVYFLICSAIVGASVAFVLTRPHVSEFAAIRSEMQTYDDDRFAKHFEALDLGLTNPLGVGPGQSHILLGGFNSHNLFLSTLAENGVVGVLSLVGFILTTFIRALVLSQKARNRLQRSLFALVAAALAGALLNSLVIDSIHWRHFWVLLGLGWMPLWANNNSRRNAQW